MKNRSSRQYLHIAFFPSPKQMANNPYWSMLTSGLNDVGVNVSDNSASLKVVWLLQNRKAIDIIHIHYIQSWYCNSGKTRARLVYVILLVFRLLIAKLFGFKIVFTLHNLEPTKPLRPGWVDFLGHWVVINLSDCVIVHCKEARRLLALTYGRKRNVCVIAHPNYIGEYPNTISKEISRNQLRISEDQFVFLFIGGIRPNKGIGTLVEAFTNLTGDHYQLFVAGNPGKEEDFFKNLKNLAALDKRTSLYLGYIPDDQFQVFFNACDVVVLPFSKILTSGSANLAMSFGKPVIAPRVGCLPELIEPGMGWLFEQDNPVSLARIMELAAQSNVEQAGKKAFEKLTRYTPERFAQQTLMAYKIIGKSL